MVCERKGARLAEVDGVEGDNGGRVVWLAMTPDTKKNRQGWREKEGMRSER